MEEIGLRELRQNASDLVRRAQAGEQITITVSGRPAAAIGPIGTRAWRSWNDIAELFTATPGDDDWASDKDLLDHDLQDPWDRS
ncbi:MAG TPA: type II toxin-antitoxin system prevent-host-death family antitoxin [Kineosporiaceae bacterium]|nr:type II toxin-antitoxin system prevent-host-death family antitoxin [Kineosporiaceae bacterium]